MVKLLGLLIILILGNTISPVAQAIESLVLMRSALQEVCAMRTRADLKSLPNRLQGLQGSSYKMKKIKLFAGRRRIISFDDGSRLLLDWVAPKGALYHIQLQYDLPKKKPEIFVVVDSRCRLRTARRVVYDDQQKPQWLEQLTENFAIKERESLNPDIPAATDPEGVPVALIDTGINYLLPLFNDRLARDKTGALLGYDYWDDDPLPYDFQPVRSAFYPIRHGTKIASLLLREAPVAKLLPYRYPHHAMYRMGEMIDHIASHGVRLVNISLVDRELESWHSFADAAKRQQNILFVVAAGNRRQNLDKNPMYPAALDLDNMITVTAATAEGKLAKGVNWGLEAVDILVYGENIDVTDYDGFQLQASGSSYATAKITALAACLLAKNPAWNSQQLKRAILRLAKTPDQPGLVSKGYISDSELVRHGCTGSAGLS